jgi:predicted neutral ceramidase superfamily lipid hydrolase
VTAVLLCIGLVIASILISTGIAWVWKKYRGWPGYLICTLAVWVAISMRPLFTQPWETPRFPVDFAHFLANLIALAPFAVLPVLFLVPLVVKDAPVRKVAIASAVTSIFALPLSFCSGIVASCSVLRDCL